MSSDAPILVDGVFFQQDAVTGIARLWGEILRRWAVRDIGRRVVLLRRGAMLPGLEGLRVRDVPPFDPQAWQGDAAMVQGVCDELGASVFLSTYYTHPIQCPSVLWVHDMIPEQMGFDLSLPVWKQKQAALDQATAFACSSAHTLKDLRATSPANANKPAVVAGCGVSSTMRPASAAELAAFHDGFVRPKLGGRPYLFMPGHTHNYKNGQLLTQALSQMDCGNFAVLVTMPSPETERLRAVPNLIVYEGHLNEGGLRMAYAGAQCLVYPSFYEGFGLPVVEAMACGCPVICSGTSSLNEVAGDAAVLIDPRDPATLVSALKAITRPETRRTYVERGLARAAQFNWDKPAAELEALVMRTIATG